MVAASATQASDLGYFCCVFQFPSQIEPGTPLLWATSWGLDGWGEERQNPTSIAIATGNKPKTQPGSLFLCAVVGWDQMLCASPQQQREIVLYRIRKRRASRTLILLDTGEHQQHKQSRPLLGTYSLVPLVVNPFILSHSFGHAFKKLRPGAMVHD